MESTTSPRNPNAAANSLQNQEQIPQYRGAQKINPQQTTYKYKAPWGQWIFDRKQRIKDIFNDQEYVKTDNQTDVFNFGAEDFNIQDVYSHYYSKSQRYPIQAFMDLYFFDTIQEYYKNREEAESILKKTRKFAQLSQKLFNLNILEERLIARKKVLEYQQMREKSIIQQL